MSIAIAATPGRQDLHSSTMRRRVIAGTTIGNALEFFDFTVFTFLMLVIGPLFFPAASSYGQLLLTTATFGVGFLMRPVGGMLIGSYADRHGRRAAMTLTLWLMGLGCGLIAVAPTYAQMGVMGPVLMVLARLIQRGSAWPSQKRKFAERFFICRQRMFPSAPVRPPVTPLASELGPGSID